MSLKTRYQGAIICDHQVLLLKQIEHAGAYSFVEVGWFDLRHPATWYERLEADAFIISGRSSGARNGRCI